jgi:excisionase family DNA binding protein
MASLPSSCDEGPRYLDLAEAARRLRLPVHRVRTMLDDGDLSGARFGTVWLVERGDVDHRVATAAPRGRPLAAHNAWAVLALLEGREPPIPDASVRFIRRHLERPITALAPALRQRSARQLTTTTDAVLTALTDDRRVVLGGPVAACIHGLLEDASGLAPDVYVRRADAGDVVDVLRRGAGTRPVVVRIVDDDLWPFAPGERWVGPVVAAVDLCDAGIDIPWGRAGRRDP